MAKQEDLTNTITNSLFVSQTGVIQCIAVSADGQLLCSTADDKSMKVFDVINFGELST